MAQVGAVRVRPPSLGQRVEKRGVNVAQRRAVGGSVVNIEHCRMARRMGERPQAKWGTESDRAAKPRHRAQPVGMMAARMEIEADGAARLGFEPRGPPKRQFGRAVLTQEQRGAARRSAAEERKSVVTGQGVLVRVDPCGSRTLKTTTH